MVSPLLRTVASVTSSDGAGNRVVVWSFSNQIPLGRQDVRNNLEVAGHLLALERPAKEEGIVGVIFHVENGFRRAHLRTYGYAADTQSGAFTP